MRVVHSRMSAWTRLLGCCVLIMAVLVAACTFHAGGDEIAYVRDGQLWTIYADGSNATAIAGRGVLGFAWSPSHQQIVVRNGLGAVPDITSVGAPDAAGNLSVVSADGGGAVTITPAIAGLTRSDAWWNADGNRLLYAEGFVANGDQAPGAPFYILSQPDQPAGIARVVLQGGGDVPAMAADGTLVAAIDAAGVVHVGKPGTSGSAVASGALSSLPTNNRPARLLWQPRHDALLYAVASANSGTTLMLTDMRGHSRAIGTATGVLDYAFAPDGSRVLVETANAFAVWVVGERAPGSGATFSWAEEDTNAAAWWSPDARHVLVRDRSGLWLADLAQRSVKQLLMLPSVAHGSPGPTTARWHPLAGSPFDASGTRIVFADSGDSIWLGQSLPGARTDGGLYIAQLSNISAVPRLIASGAVRLPSWSYLDPGSSWLVAA